MGSRGAAFPVIIVDTYNSYDMKYPDAGLQVACNHRDFMVRRMKTLYIPMI